MSGQLGGWFKYACDDVNQVHARVDSGALRWAPQARIDGLAYDGTAPGT